MQLQLPAVLTIQSGINTPRYPSLSNLLRANKQKLETFKPVIQPNRSYGKVLFG